MYSQNNEDDIINSYFNGRIGTLLDIGANSIILSNTYQSMLNGFSGVLVEPSEKAFKMLSESYEGNSNVEMFNVAIGERNGFIDFWESNEHLGIGDTSLLSTLNQSELKRWEGSDNSFEKKTVVVWDFNTLLSKSKIKTFNLISIDIEGSDLLVLRQMDLKKLGCEIIILEHNGNQQVLEEMKHICSWYGLTKQLLINAENIILSYG